MSDPDKKETYYETLGLPPDATLDQVKSRYKELNDAYLKILQMTRSSAKTGAGRPAPPDTKATEAKPQPDADQKQHPSSPQQETRTEPIAKIRARLAKGELQKAQFEKLAKERYSYLKSKAFSDLTESEYDERIHGFEGLKFL